MANQEKFDEFVKLMFNLQLLNKIYHWNTTSYARHKATDDFNSTLGDLLDRFVEVYSGIYNIKIGKVDHIMLNPQFLSDDGIVDLYNRVITYLKKDVIIFTQDTDLLNIRDELLSELNKMLYLFRLA